MNETQVDLEGEPVPVKREEKTTTTVVWTSDYFKVSMPLKDFDNIAGGAIETPIDEFIIKRMKLHKAMPENKMGRLYREEFLKIKKAILETNPEELHEQEPPVQQPLELEEPEEGDDHQKELVETIKGLIGMDTSIDLAEHLTGNFVPEQMEEIAKALKLEIEPDALPQSVAYDISERIKAYRAKSESRR